MINYLKTILFIILSMLPCKNFAQSVINEQSYLQVLSKFSHYKSDKELSESELLEITKNEKFQNEIKENLIDESGYLYLRFIVKNTSSETDFLASIYKMEEVFLYSFENGFFTKKIGQNAPMSQREIKSGFRNYGKIKINSNSVDTVYACVNMNINSIKLGTVSFELSSQKRFDEVQPLKHIIQGILAGALLIMGFYNLLLYFIIREKSYLLYVSATFLVACIWLSSAGDGYFLQHLYPEFPELAKFDNILLTSIYVILLTRFIQVYLQTKVRTPKWHMVLFLPAILQLLLTIIRLVFTFSFEIEEFITFFIGIVLLSIIFALSIYNLFNKIPQSSYFLYGNIVLYPLAMYYMFWGFGSISPSSFSFAYYSFEIGNVIEMFFFSMALGSRLTTMQKKQHLLEKDLHSVKTTLDSIKKETNSYYFIQSAIEVKFEEIILLESSGHYVLIYVKDRENPLSERIKMADLIAYFPNTLFVKIHRSFYINVNHIVSRPSKYLIKMSNGQEVKASRNYVENLGEKFLK